MWQTAIVVIIVAVALVAALRRATRAFRVQSRCSCSGGCAKRDNGGGA